VLPLFLIMTLAIVEFGWAIYASTTINSAAHEGARRGMVLSRLASGQGGNSFSGLGNSDGTYEGPHVCSQSTIVGMIACNIGVLPSSRITVVLSTPDEVPPTQNVISGNEIVVTIHYQYRPWVGSFLPIPNNLTLTGTATTFTT
jgi:Flp pilus assembly protein TadG